jgi:polysaccharide export outer membrane protein
MFSSCVTNKKYVYLQKEDLHEKNTIKDSVLRTYHMRIREYRIQPLDILSIRMESLTEESFDFMSKLYPGGGSGGAVNNFQAQLLNGFLIDNNGDIEFPVVGKIHLGGLSLFEAQEKLQETFKPYLKDPVARVRLLNFRFTVLGEVNGENQIVSQNSRVTLMEAIGLAGGLTDLADRSNVKIIRQREDQSEIFYMNLLNEDILTSEHYFVQQNDVIVVSALRQRPFRRYWGQNLSLFVSTVSVILLTLNLIER